MPLRRWKLSEPKARTPKRFQDRRDPLYAMWVRQKPCLLAGPECMGPVEAAHVKSRGAGGDDRANLVPLCTTHHREQHQGIKTFQRVHRLDLRAIAARLAREYARLR